MLILALLLLMPGAVFAQSAGVGGPYFRDDCLTGLPIHVANKILCWEQTTAQMKTWDGAAWVGVGGGSGTVTHSGTLTANAFILGNGTVSVKALALTGYVFGNGVSAPTAITTIPTSDLSGALLAAQFPALTGDVTTVEGALAATLAASGVTPGTYTKVTVDAKGRVTVGATFSFATDGTGNLPVTRLNSGTGATGSTFWAGDGTWKTTSGAGGGTVTNTGAMTASAVVVGNGGVDVKVLASLGTTTTVLHGNAAGLPTFGAVSLTADVSGTLPVANGGTGATTLTLNGVLYGNGTSAAQITAQGAARTVLVANAGAPSFSSTPQVTSLTVGDSSISNGAVTWRNATNANTFTLQTGISASNLTFILPIVDGAAGTCLSTNGSGVFGWANCSSGGTGLTTLNGQTGNTQIFANDTNVQIVSATNIHTLTWVGLLGAARGGLGVNAAGTSGAVSFNSGTGVISNVLGTPGRVLYSDVGNAIGSNASFTWDNTNKVLNLNANAAAIPSGPTGTLLRIAGLDNVSTYATIDVYGATPAPGWQCRRSRGTAASPSAVVLDDQLCVLAGFGRGATGYSSTARGTVGIYAANGGGAGNTWTDTSQPTNLTFATTAVGSLTLTERMRVDSAGKVGIGTSVPSNTLTVSDTVNGAQGYFTSNQNNAGFQINNTQAGGRNWQFLASGGSAATPSSFRIVDVTAGGVDRIVINSSGNVGITAAFPTARLSVDGNGTSIATSLFVNGGIGTPGVGLDTGGLTVRGSRFNGSVSFEAVGDTLAAGTGNWVYPSSFYTIKTGGTGNRGAVLVRQIVQSGIAANQFAAVQAEMQAWAPGYYYAMNPYAMATTGATSSTNLYGVEIDVDAGGVFTPNPALITVGDKVGLLIAEVATSKATVTGLSAALLFRSQPGAGGFTRGVLFLPEAPSTQSVKTTGTLIGTGLGGTYALGIDFLSTTFTSSDIRLSSGAYIRGTTSSAAMDFVDSAYTRPLMALYETRGVGNVTIAPTFSSSRDGQGSVDIPPLSFLAGGPTSKVFVAGLGIVDNDTTNYTTALNPTGMNNGAGSAAFNLQKNMGAGFGGIGIALNLATYDTRTNNTSTVEHDQVNLWSTMVSNSNRVAGGCIITLTEFCNVNAINAYIISVRVNALNSITGQQIEMVNGSTSDAASHGLVFKPGEESNRTSTEGVMGDAIHVLSKNVRSPGSPACSYAVCLSGATDGWGNAFNLLALNQISSIMKIRNDGTIFMNAPIGTSANLVELQTGGSSKFIVTSDGRVAASLDSSPAGGAVGFVCIDVNNKFYRKATACN